MARFRKGVSGNPGGRLRRGLSITEHIRELLDLDYAELRRIHAYLEDKGEERLGRITVGRLVACRIIAQAVAGQSELTKELLNRIEGKVPDKLDVNEKRSINIRIELASAQNQRTLSSDVVEGEEVVLSGADPKPEDELSELARQPASLEDRNPERPSDG
jgi:Family of unknown function (DUF5681)